MLPDRVSNSGPLTYESGALPIALRGPAPGPRFTIILKDWGIKMGLSLQTTKFHFLSGV